MMPLGTSLSRWTMSYFGAALFFLLLAESLLSAGIWAPSSAVAEPDALIIVHSMTIGWLGLLMIGALLQFTPVLTGLGLPTGRFDLPCLVGSMAGLGLLLCGFQLIDAGSAAAGPVMIAASAILLASLLSIAWVLLSGLWRGRAAHPASPLVMLGLTCLAVTVALGSLFAVTVSGPAATPSISEFVANAVPFHASFGLAGWMTFAAIGVSYKLLPMFLLSDEMKKSPFIRNTGSFAATTLGFAAVATIFEPSLGQRVFLVGSLFFQLPIAAYLAELFLAYRARRRKDLELNMSGSLPAFVLLGLSVPMFAVALASDAGPQSFTAIAYLFVFGWLTGLGLSQLLKIIPFLTWIEAFGPLLGRRPTPRLADLLNGRRAAAWLCIFYLAVVASAAAIAAGSDAGFRLAVTAQTFATAALVTEFVLVRRLANIDSAAKGAPFQQPALFVAAKPQR
ncbi:MULTISPECIES: hypothetical protein [Rhizobium]|uniref:hypothetical protein n=1 Tax=Rhizobium TaxID=379 RepID=UPI0007E97FFA|nr:MULTISPECIES: hypothetical protein [Rhizobium]ANK93865.1 hypothetical protein AMK01_PA00149 [Rhizobium sp. N6212]ANK99915.1 hypothetical protein AMK00_PA00149 [Rhizobium sp. N621]ANL06045.1 hypothetical protein AMJ99_PA00149 [Rhizobium esperanzae]ANL12210.1 hypothetical protein AMJ98_PB00149 [Rhizobium sp. N1341]ANM36884.1 hypothetical protein AMK04_PA00149 [Rhizobium sp. N871]